MAASAAARVLIVDDDLDTVDSAAMLFRLQGHLVETALTGRAAIERVRGFEPDLVLLDVHMPDMDGHAVARSIRREFPVNSPVLVAVSGYCRSSDMLRSADAGFDLHLAKPVDPAVLEQLTLLPQRTQTLMARTRELAEQHAIALGTLVTTQLEMARTVIDLAMNESNEERKQRHRAAAIRVCENVARCLVRTNIPERDEVMARLAELRKRLGI
jgi:CheY-like chemotaxis protein